MGYEKTSLGHEIGLYGPNEPSRAKYFGLELSMHHMIEQETTFFFTQSVL